MEFPYHRPYLPNLPWPSLYHLGTRPARVYHSTSVAIAAATVEARRGQIFVIVAKVVRKDVGSIAVTNHNRLVVLEELVTARESFCIG